MYDGWRITHFTVQLSHETNHSKLTHTGYQSEQTEDPSSPLRQIRSTVKTKFADTHIRGVQVCYSYLWVAENPGAFRPAPEREDPAPHFDCGLGVLLNGAMTRSGAAIGLRAREASAAPPSTIAPPSRKRPPRGSCSTADPRATAITVSMTGMMPITTIGTRGMSQNKHRKASTVPRTERYSTEP